VLGWATGHLPEPPNSPQVGMANMRALMPALQRAKAVAPAPPDLAWDRVALPRQVRDTRVVKDMTPDEIAREIVEWVR
jgi:electron transfer flavoprotein beta subunit